MRECVEAMRVLWTEDVAEYHDRLVDVPPTWQWPQPSPPVLMGGAGPNVLNRVVGYCDGWLPAVHMNFTEDLRGRFTPIEEFAAEAKKLQQLAEERGRPRPIIQVTSEVVNRIPLGELEKLGVTRVMMGLQEAKDEDVRPLLERHRETIAKLTGS